MPLHKDLKQAVAKVTADSNLFHDIVHGPETATVVTEAGSVKTVAKAIKEVETSLQGHLTALTQAVAQAQAAKGQAEAALNAAVAAGDRAAAAVGGVGVTSQDQAPSTLHNKIMLARGLKGIVTNSGGDEQLELSVTNAIDAASGMFA